MLTRRKTDPIYLQFIWDALDACFNLSLKPNLENIFNFISNEKDSKTSLEKIESELSNCIDDGCVTLLRNEDYVKEKIQSATGTSHDFYCYECHEANCDFACDLCYRSFHYECLDKAEESISSNLMFSSVTSVPKFSRSMSNCPVCVKTKKLDDTACMEVDLKNIFLSALNNIKNKNSWKLLGHIGYVNDSARNSYLLVREINTKIIGRKMRLDKGDCENDTSGPPLKCYRNRNELLLDLDHLVHNSAVIYGMKNDMCQSARQIRCVLRREMRESTLCIDCYINCGKSGKSIVTPCRNDHKIIWFQHNGWSFWPCKVLHESQDGYEVVRFGGRHERTFVPRDRGHDFVFSAAEMGLRITPALKKALVEVDEYQANRRLHEHISKSGLSSYQTQSLQPNLNNKNWSGRGKLEKTKSLQPMKKRQEIRSKGKEIPRHSSGNHLSKSFLSDTDDSPASSPGCSDPQLNNVPAPSSSCSSSIPQQNVAMVASVNPTPSRSSSLSSLTMSEDEDEVPEKKHEVKSSGGLVLRIKPIPPPSKSQHNGQITKNMSQSCENASPEPVKSSTVQTSQLIPSSDPSSKTKRKSESKNYSIDRKKRKSIPSEPSSNRRPERQRHPKKGKQSVKSTKIFTSSSSEAHSDNDTVHNPCTSPINVIYERAKYPSSTQHNNNNNLSEDLTPTNIDSSPSSLVDSETTKKSNHHHVMPSPDKLILSSRKNLNSDYSSLSGSATPVDSIIGRSLSQKSTSPDKWSNPNFSQSASVSQTVSTNSGHIIAGSLIPGSSSRHLQHNNHPHSSSSGVSSVSPAALSSSSSSGLGSCCLSDINVKSIDVSPGDNYRHNQRAQQQQQQLTSSSSAGNLLVATGETNQKRQINANLIPQLDPSFIKAIEDQVAAKFEERLNKLTLERDMIRENYVSLEKQIKDLRQHHADELDLVKRKCWCIVCLAEANYHCCAAISYCSQTCQYQHWKTDHSKVCKRINHS